MKKKSLRINASLNGFNKIISMIFQLITFPYISRVLQVETLGKINFSNSIVSYFLLIAGLGITTYATREGARLRDDKNKITQFSSQVFTLSLISTLVAYILLVIVTFKTATLHPYAVLIAIQSINILGSTLGINWLYSIYEDYLYITIRTIAFQFLSLLMLFTFVNSKEDYIIYAWISVISTSGSNILNIFRSKKYIKLKLTKNISIKKHLTPIIIIFSSTIATTIYVYSDSTMLGFISGEYSVGLYSTSVNIYTIIKSLLASVILVALPRLSNYVANNKIEEFKVVVYSIFDKIMIVVPPIIVGIFFTAKEIILILAGPNYIEAVPSLQILSIGLLFSILSIYYTNAVLLPMSLEKIIFGSTLISAVVNIVLNFLFINMWQQNGAALTTVLSEVIVCSAQYLSVKKKIPLKLKMKDITSIFLGCALIFMSCAAIDKFAISFTLKFVVKVIISSVMYLMALFFMKNSAFKSIISHAKIN